ncbi:hypothetical protein ABB02_01809 [Clostridiaceae bacterium JG1575]|nr:hypothetical protein ABB02_01809 [Clostridiaceae bacterium JG1575]
MNQKHCIAWILTGALVLGGCSTKAPQGKEPQKTQPTSQTSSAASPPVVQIPSATRSQQTVVKTTPQTSAPAPVKTAPETKIETPKTPEDSAGIPPQMKKALDEDHAMILVFDTKKYPTLRATTAWDIKIHAHPSELFLITKKANTKVTVTGAVLVDAGVNVRPGDPLREWTTKTDFEVIRMVYSDPETMPFNFIRLTEPGGRTFIAPIFSSMREHPDWEAYAYSQSRKE